MSRYCVKCGNLRWYDAFTKRNSKESGFHGDWCWDCYQTDKWLKEIEAKREKQFKNMEQVTMRTRYANSEDGKKAHMEANRRYLTSEKGKAAKAAANARYREKKKQLAPKEPKEPRKYESLPPWLLSTGSQEAQKASSLRYRQSEKGKAANRAAQARYRAKKVTPDWLK